MINRFAIALFWFVIVVSIAMVAPPVWRSLHPLLGELLGTGPLSFEARTFLFALVVVFIVVFLRARFEADRWLVAVGIVAGLGLLIADTVLWW